MDRKKVETHVDKLCRTEMIRYEEKISVIWGIDPYQIPREQWDFSFEKKKKKQLGLGLR